MRINELLKTLLPGLMPLIVFILADEIWGTEIGLYIAVSFGLVQILVIFIKEKRIDRFVLFDILLISFMGAVSIILENEIFFKLKPAIIGIILISILGVSAFSPKNIMMLMSKRYLKGIEFNEEQNKTLLRSIKLLFWIFTIHTMLIIYSAFFLSKEAWAFISGVLFYVVFVAFIAFEFIRNIIKRKKSTKEEILSEIDEDGKIIGTLSRSIAHDGSKRLHPVIHVHIINSKNEILLQKRSITKKIQPGKWDTAVGGHIAYNEKIEIALVRETKEELGLKNLDFKFITKYIWESEIEKEMVFVFYAKHEEFKFKPNAEVLEVKFWSQYLINKNLGVGVFTPNFEIEYQNILKPNLDKL